MCQKVSKVDVSEHLDYEQSLIFLRDSRVGEHASARENHLEEMQPRVVSPRGDFRLRSHSLPLDYPL